MSLRPFLKRELAISARSGRASKDREIAVILAGSTVVGCLLLWDKQGWDRESILGAHRFGLAVFGVLVFGMSLTALGCVVQHVSAAIAAERDRKSLDALLASRFSSFEIVVGAVVVGLFRYANALAAMFPVVVLMVYMGGVAPIWAVLAGVGLASTACLLAGFAVAASIEARTANRAMVVGTGWFAAWLTLPTMYLFILRPFLWPSAPGWLTSMVITVGDSSPMGLLSNLLGVAPRPGGPLGAVGRMAGWQLVGTLALVAWSVARLRPASRSLYDVEGEQGRIKRLKAALRRPPRRPACSDDPVFWCEAYSSRGEGLLRRLVGRTINLVWLLALVVGTWWYAKPAFEELAARGYGASPEAFSLPEVNPMVRLLVRVSVPSLSSTALPGQARLEFNIVVRIFTCIFILAFTMAAFTVAFESIKGERRRDTWLGLLATPLTAREILRGKALGSLWKVRWAALTLVALWTIGLLAGAVHPLGYLASLAFLAVSASFYASLGLLMALQEWDPEKQAKSSLTLIHLPFVLVGSLLLTAGPMALGWASLLTYEDVAAAIGSGPFPALGHAQIAAWIDARGVLVGLLAGIGGLAFGAFWLKRKNERWFDRAVGRPVRADG
jgi:ABC-type transport system involved in multi-copper enzyme maturation permease subunit